MKEFKYPVFPRLLYRFGNLPFTILLLILLIPEVVNLDTNLFLIVPLVITLLLIYFLNRFYINLYKILPYEIRLDNNGMTCNNFIFSDKKIEIYFSDIESLNGGVFEGQVNGLMKVNSKNNISIGFYNSIRYARELETIILSKVNKSVYEEVARKISKNLKTEIKK
jgi:hypothetical protein